MKIFAISDLHLSTACPKPMDIFGDGWQNHFEKVSADWNANVSEDDLVLLGGDLSWGLTIEQAKPDFDLISALPGKKVVIKGNHDYYWNSLSKMRTAFPVFNFVQNNAVKFGKVIIAGTRGWTIPDEDSSAEDKKIYARELQRLELSLSDAERKKENGDTLIAMLHFPPFDAKYSDTEVTEILQKHSVDYVLYGHLHGKSARVTETVEKAGIKYFLTSCDLIKNKLIKIVEVL